MEQLASPVYTAETLPEGYLPCSNPELVEGYVSIAEIFEGSSVDFCYCDDHETVFCDCNMDEKREDEQFPILLEHFRNGGALNQPLNYRPAGIVEPDCSCCSEYERESGEMGNGHHRLIAAYDAGYTHVPYNSRKWGSVDWRDTPNSEGRTY